VFWRRALFENVGGLNPDFHLAMDADLWIRFADAGARFAHARRVWSQMRFYPAQKNQRLRHISDAEDASIRSRYYRDETAPARLARRTAAAGLRAAMRAVTGCYSVSDPRDLRKALR